MFTANNYFKILMEHFIKNYFLNNDYSLYEIKRLYNKISKKYSWNYDEFLIINLIITIAFRILKFPFIILYFIYIKPPLFICRKITELLILIIHIYCRKSSHARHIVEHSSALFKICENIAKNISTLKLNELISISLTTILEIILTIFFGHNSDSSKRVYPFISNEHKNEGEVTELIYYEEMENNENEEDCLSKSFRRTVRSMHNNIPLNPFKATIRLNSKGTVRNMIGSPLMQNNYGSLRINIPQTNDIISNHTHHDMISSSIDFMDVDSPASFPATPFSRAYVMNRSSEKVTSVMFAARDVLRLEAQSVSRDEYSRLQAKEAQSTGKLAVFDHMQNSIGLALTCGNHCVMKVGQGLCCCCRSMIPIRPNTYVYFEFSVTVSSSQIPTLGIGLTPPDAPLNVMVGSWARSVGFYADGQVLIGSRWYQSSNGKKIQAGSTVGMLVYIPSTSTTNNNSANKNINVVHNESIQSPMKDVNKSYSNKVSIFNSFLDSFHGVSSTIHDNNNNNNNNEDDNKDDNISINPNSTYNNTTPINKLQFHFTLDGIKISHPNIESSEILLNEVITMDTPLYPTVGIFSMDTRVWCRFCEADVVYRTRKAIGAPNGVRVYCLDGTVLLQENDE